jgi:hypothetical protein
MPKGRTRKGVSHEWHEDKVELGGPLLPKISLQNSEDVRFDFDASEMIRKFLADHPKQ